MSKSFENKILQNIRGKYIKIGAVLGWGKDEYKTSILGILHNGTFSLSILGSLWYYLDKNSNYFNIKQSKPRQLALRLFPLTTATRIPRRRLCAEMIGRPGLSVNYCRKIKRG